RRCEVPPDKSLNEGPLQKEGQLLAQSLSLLVVLRLNEGPLQKEGQFSATKAKETLPPDVPQ
ncbi:hypothetical protein, partial [Propionibacterium freudenreichii]|uniref:hypothetical protein n=1 Tax=Propionibacterium freudenreichii TaxID=1744 RepID=UPI0039BF1EF1